MSIKPSSLLLHLSTTIISISLSTSQPQCRSFCGRLPINYPLSIDDGCGNPLYRNLLFCNTNNPSPALLLRTPSGSYPVISLSYSKPNPHLIISDPSMSTCNSPSPSPPFSLDSSTPFTLSSKTSFIFLNCSPESVIIEPRSPFCDRAPERCAFSCDSNSYVCRNLPGCNNLVAEREMSCCEFYPTGGESVRRMIGHCGGYAGVYWRGRGDGGDVVAEYGIRVDFRIPATARCRSCVEKGKGVCGFDRAKGSFLCHCAGGISTATNCEGEIFTE